MRRMQRPEPPTQRGASGNLADSLTELGRITKASVKGLDILLQVATGVVDENGAEEISDGVRSYGIPGMVARPLPPERAAGKDYHCEVLVLRTGNGGMVPLAYRDTRIGRAFPSGLAEGQMAFAGYGGGFFSLSLTAGNTGDQRGNVMVAYCPYEFSDGTPSKAMAVIMDPTPGNESVSIVHGEGQAVLMQNDGSIQLQSPSGQSYIKITNEGITMQSGQIVANGGAVVIGAPVPGTAVPLLAGPASPPCPRLFVNPAA